MKDKWVASEPRVKGELPVELMSIEKDGIHHLPRKRWCMTLGQKMMDLFL